MTEESEKYLAAPIIDQIPKENVIDILSVKSMSMSDGMDCGVSESICDRCGRPLGGIQLKEPQEKINKEFMAGVNLLVDYIESQGYELPQAVLDELMRRGWEPGDVKSKKIMTVFELICALEQCDSKLPVYTWQGPIYSCLGEKEGDDPDQDEIILPKRVVIE